jgi:hypothetical protein
VGLTQMVVITPCSRNRREARFLVSTGKVLPPVG